MADEEMLEMTSRVNPLYIFTCAVAWARSGDCEAGREVMLLWNDPDPEVRALLRCVLSYVRYVPSIELLYLRNSEGRVPKRTVGEMATASKDAA
jgi:hypothetical protein